MKALLCIVGALCLWAWVVSLAAEVFVQWMYGGEQ